MPIQDDKNVSEIKLDDQKIIANTELNIWEALIPVIALVGMLAYNIYVYGDDALSGSNQFILLMGAAVAAVVGFFNKVKYKRMLEEVAENVKSTTGALLILLMVGALAGTWLISGAVVSTTLIVCTKVVSLPHSSTSVHVLVMVDSFAQDPSATLSA